jgi:hypothetical protein
MTQGTQAPVSAVAKTWNGQRLLGRILAVPVDYAELYADPQSGRRGAMIYELSLASTCAVNGNEDAT